MPSKIRVLSDQTINQIAAGEVIENPASVIKELVENSIDAGATAITIEIRGGGRQMIRITDNGCGMAADDAVLCLERHATSKIRLLDDLDHLSTLGFRGEAVPSIASISKVNILTRLHDQPEGTMVIVDGGKLISCTPAACTPGTTFEVKALFFNVPVRKKFQKSPAYDTQEIQKVVSLIALAHPTIKFELISNQENLLQTYPQENSEAIRERVKEVLGHHFIEDAHAINLEKGNLCLQGFLGSPFQHRPNRTGQYLFINQRPVISTSIAYAVKEGFGMTLPPNRYPVFVLFMTMPGNEVDVNVHPQKKEVRLSHEQQLRQWITQGVQNALGPQAAPTFDIEEKIILPPLPTTPNFPPRPSTVPIPIPLKPQAPMRQLEIAAPTPSSAFQPSLKVLAVIQGYVLVDPIQLPNQISKRGLCLVDPQAAQTRIIFEKLLLQQGPSESQSLLVPYTLDLIPTEAKLLKSRLDDLQKIGISLREFGPSTFMIDTLPDFLNGTDIPQLIQGYLAEIQEHQSSGTKLDIRRRLALASCKMAKHYFDKLTIQGAQSIMDRLMRCENPYQSPFGKPTMVHITPEELAGKFQK